MSKIADSVISIPCSLEGNFMNLWLTFLTPLHKLTPSIVNLAAEILKHRFRLSQVIKDEDILDNYLLSNEEIRNAIIDKCKLSTSNYHVSIGKLKKAGFFIGGKVNPKFIPKVKVDKDHYSLLLLFKMPIQENVKTE